MKRPLLFFLAMFMAASALAQNAFAQSGGPKVQAGLIAEQASVAPGGTVTIALEEKIADGWHTYWVNPGDAGAPTDIQWTLPPGWKAGAIQWPRPKRLPVGPLMDYGYEGKLWLLAPIIAPANAKPGDSATLKAAVSWLVCKQICIPEDTILTIPVTIGGGGPDASVAKDFAAARALLPVASPWHVNYALQSVQCAGVIDPNTNEREHRPCLDLYVAAPSLAAAHPTSVEFFPANTGQIRNAAAQITGYAANGLVLRMTSGLKANGLLEGVLVLGTSDGAVQALTVSAPPGPVPAADFPASQGGGLTLALSLLFALLGGLILNVMPCVLPILAMKALALARHQDSGARAESFAYALGAVVTFVIFGFAIVLLREGGASVGWGFQLQEPLAVAGFALLIFAVGLNLSGLFEVGAITAGESLTRRSGLGGAFFTGVLAVAVAAPCTAPFMAAALGFALTQSVGSALAIFAALGVGFALPFLLLGLWPRALAFMPRPGPWMLRLKQFLAFPMYAAAAWLVWVLAQEAGPTGVAAILMAMVALALAIWLWSATRDLTPRGRGIGALAALLVLAAGFSGLALLRTSSAPAAAKLAGDAYSAAKLVSLRASGRPVFVDATAAWCITCLVNEDAVLSRQSVKDAFAARHVAYLVADWTNRNDEITQLLKQNGRSGVPLYLYYAPGAGTPVILSQVLTEGEVMKALGG